MPEGPWKRGWKDWSGRGWLLRSVGLPLIGFGIGYLVGLMAHWPPWVAGLIGAIGAPLVWGLATLAISFLKSPGKVIGERDSAIAAAETRIRELEASRPRLSACLREDETRLLLSVTNAGESAWVWATIAVSSTRAPRSGVSAIWRHTPKDRSRLTMHETRDIVVAERRRDDERWNQLKYYWYVPFIEDGQRVETRSLEPAIPSYPGYDSSVDPDARTVRQDVRISVVSDPPSLEPPIYCTIALIGCDMWEAQGVPTCPQPPPPADLPRSTASE
jgi:hypothetical protein